jgi:hypothetical protein
MKEQQDFEQFNKAVKLTLLMQASLELMDEMRGLKMYRHDIKNTMKILEKKIERHINNALLEMGKNDEFIMMQIQRGIDAILNTTLEDIHNETL